jgi:hypothetical protein
VIHYHSGTDWARCESSFILKGSLGVSGIAAGTVVETPFEAAGSAGMHGILRFAQNDKIENKYEDWHYWPAAGGQDIFVSDSYQG